jgi:porphobilinogen synthase
MSFPAERPRRLRRSAGLRRLVRETKLSVDDLVMPLFVLPGSDKAEPIASMPGQFRYSADRLARECEEIASLGVPAVILFGIPERKDAEGSEAWREDGVVQTAVREIKRAAPDLVVIADVCLCEYTDHGHCGVVEGGRVLNDATIELLARTSVSLARAGADVIAPSDMMDGRVGRIRRGLDEAGFLDTAILSYAVKYASAFYGPFRDAAGSSPSFGDRSGYQMDPANADEAMREARLDIEEGADIIMVKPALPYLDIVRRVKEEFSVPTAAYCVSGEYSMIKAAAAQGWLDERRAVLEALTAIRRAGADFVLTYFAKEAAKWLARNGTSRSAGPDPRGGTR